MLSIDRKYVFFDKDTTLKEILLQNMLIETFSFIMIYEIYKEKFDNHIDVQDIFYDFNFSF